MEYVRVIHVLVRSSYVPVVSTVRKYVPGTYLFCAYPSIVRTLYHTDCTYLWYVRYINR